MNRIRDLREDKDLRQIDVSAATGIDQKTLSNYETEKTHPDSEALIRLADYFDVSIDYLVGRNYNRSHQHKEIIQQISKLQNDLEKIKRSLDY